MKAKILAVAVFAFAVAAVTPSAQTVQTFFSFNGTDGANPCAGLTLGKGGSFYGTTEYGGSSGYGTIFKVQTDGALTTLLSFNLTDGANPQAALRLGNDGNFLGSASVGGSMVPIDGTVFNVTTNGTLIWVVSFHSANDGEHPNGLTLGNDGNFYGTTQEGGESNSDGGGTVFQMTPSGTLTTLATFSDTSESGPFAALTLGEDGNFYGTTEGGGSVYGTIFKVTTNGTLTTLFAFNNTDGAYPNGLTLGNDGNFYGTTQEGGAYNVGTVFKLTTNGKLSTLYSFTGGYHGDGAMPNGLVLASDGNFYGTTIDGTVFVVTTNGTLTTLLFFPPTSGRSPNVLTQGNDGNFYGTTQEGGIVNSSFPSGCGTVFRILLPPLIGVQPQGQTNIAGATAQFVVSATSLNDPPGYQWRKNGTNLVNGGNLSGTTTNTLTITDISDSDTATYSVLASNVNGSVTSSEAILTVIDPPVITAQPTNELVSVGNNIAFSVSVSGTSPLGYQWFFNCYPILNATSSIYRITPVNTNNAGNYSVVTTNLAGSVTSSVVMLSVAVPPVILSQPQSLAVTNGHAASFVVTADGWPSLAYQWLLNGTNIVGATDTALLLQNVFPANAGAYTVQVTDAYGSITSNPAMLTVFPLCMVAPTILAGGQFQFSFDTATGVNYAVEYSTNLTQWFPFVTLGGVGVPLTLIDPNAASSQQRFYHIVLSPQ